METTPGPPEHEKYGVDNSCPEHKVMHYVTHRCHRMQKHKFGVMCPVTLSVETVPGPPEHVK
jgi:hypothetical protein